MATTEEIVAKYRLDLDDLQKQVKTLENQFEKVDDATAESAKNSQKSVDKISDSLKTLGKTVVAAFAVDRIIAFGKASLKAFEEAEQAALKLSSAVSINGGVAQDVDRLLKQADQLETKSIFSAEQINALQTAALQFGLTADEVERLTPIVVDFASATGQDLNSAFGVIQAGVSGAEKGLRAYGVQLEEGAGKAQNYAAITEQLTKKFQGQAAAINETTSGQLKQLDDAWGDIQETVGAAIAPIVVGVSKAIRSVADFREASKTEAEALQDQRSQLGAYQIALTSANTTQEDRVRIINELKGTYKGYLDNIDAEKVKNTELLPTLRKINDELINKIALAGEDEKIAAANEKVGKARGERARLELKALELLNKAQEAGADLGGENLTIEEKLLRAASDRTLKAKATGGILIDAETRLRTNLEDTRRALAVAYSQEQQANQALTASENGRIKVAERLGIVLTEAGTKAADSAQKQLDYAKLTDKELTELVKKNQSTLAQGELDRRKKQREEAAKAAKEAADAATKAAEAAQKQAEEEAKQRDDLRKQGLEQDTANLQLYAQERLRLLNQQYDAEAQLAQANAAAQQAQALADLQAGLITYAEYEKRKAAIAAAVTDNTAQREQAKLRLELDTLEKQKQNLLDYGQDVGKIDQDIADKRAALAAASVAIDQDAAARRLAVAEEEAQAQEKLLEELEAKRQTFNQATLDSAQKLADSIVGLLNVQVENETKALEESRAQQVEQYDAQQADLDAQLEKRLISQQVYEQRSAQLKDQRIKSEQDINKKMADLKRRQDAAAKAQALYRIGIDTAAAIQAQLKETPLPAGAFFVAAIAASGLLQAGTVLAAKPPQYAEGVDWVPLGRNKRGRDTIPAMLDEGERVVSRRKNLDNWDLYEAIDHGKLDQFIFRRYTLPALQAERAKGGPVVQALGQLLGSANPSADGPDSAELRRLFRRGLPITNLDELADVLTRHQPSPYRA